MGDTLEAQSWLPPAALTQLQSYSVLTWLTPGVPSMPASYLGSNLTPATYWLCDIGRVPTLVLGDSEGGRKQCLARGQHGMAAPLTPAQ